MPEGNVIDLEAIRSPIAGKVRTHDGVEHAVRQITVGVFRSLKAATAATAVDELVKNTQRLVPTLTEEQLEALDVPQMEYIMAVASGSIPKVEEAFPNAPAPAPATEPQTGSTSQA